MKDIPRYLRAIEEVLANSSEIQGKTIIRDIMQSLEGLSAKMLYKSECEELIRRLKEKYQ